MTTHSSLTMATRVPLSSGTKNTMPILGYGLLQTPADEAGVLVSEALKVGYRNIDCATMYENEAATGAAIRASGLPRETLFYTSKSLPNKLGYENTVQAVESSLKLAGLDYIDLYLLHAPYGGKEARLESWRALVEAQRAGKVRTIGVSNYGVHHLEELEAYIKEVDAREGEGRGGKISVGQWELNPWLARKDITDWCEKRGIVIQAYSPLVRGTKMSDPLLKPLVEKYSKSPAQILLRWSLQKVCFAWFFLYPVRVGMRLTSNIGICTAAKISEGVSDAGEL
jgi:diketogulonate reductase-like aldo/keto reductase